MRVWVFLLVAILFGCRSHEIVSNPVVTDYFPVKTGAWWIYQIDSIVTEQYVATTYKYQLKIVVSDSIIAPDGEFVWVLQRQKRTDESSPWYSLPSWSSRVTNYQAVVVEGNVSYIRISSPLQNANYWDGNALNDLSGNERCPGGSSSTCDLYTIADFSNAYTGTGTTFDNTLTVVENNDQEPIISEDVRSEVYARRVGLVYREIIRLTYCQDETLNCTGQQIVSQGINYKQSYISNGGL